MIESSLARTGYENSLQSTGSSRAFEYQLFARVTRQLSDNDRTAADFSKKRSEALFDNLKLWTKLAIDVAKESNQLPPQLRSSIFFLAEFTRHHTSKVYQNEATTDALVEINMSVMRGLKNKITAEREAS